MKFTRFLFFSLTLISTLTTISCKKDKEPGPQGPQGIQGEPGPQGPKGASYDPDQLWTRKEGFAKAVIIGSTLENNDYQYNLDFRGVFNEYENYYYYNSTLNQHIVHIYKTFAGNGDVFRKGFISLEFSVPDIHNPTTATLISGGILLDKNLGNDTVFYLNRDYASGGGHVGVLSNLFFNPDSKIISGDFQIAFPKTATTGAFTLDNGSFSSKLIRLVARQGE